jgi:hypothetical protein
MRYVPSINGFTMCLYSDTHLLPYLIPRRCMILSSFDDDNDD